MITREQIMGACTLSFIDPSSELARAFAAFVAIDGSRMYVSASEEFKACKASLPPLLALERLRGQVDGSRRGELASMVISAFGEDKSLDVVMHCVTGITPKQRPCTRMFAAELVADAMLLASEFASAWNRSKIVEVGRE